MLSTTAVFGIISRRRRSKTRPVSATAAVRERKGISSLLRRSLAVISALAAMMALAPIQPAFASAIVVNSSADTIANDGLCTLREAINAANDDTVYFNCPSGFGADTISFAAGYTITLGDQLPPITSQITISGKGAANTIIQANASPNVANYRLFYVTASGSLTLQSLTVRNGRCNGIMLCSTFGSSAGAIFNGGTLTISRSTVSGNSGSLGGAIYNQGTLTIVSSSLSGNNASDGGGIYNDSGATATISSSVFSGNSSSTGGGATNGGTMTVENSSFAANSATFNGGGLYNGSVLTVNNSTFSGNAASPGAGIYNGSTLHLRNSIIANSTAGGDCGTIAPLATNVNNLIEDGSCSPALSGDPKLSALGNYGGFTRTFALLSGSPAIDAGNPVTCTSSDQRGYPRPQDGNNDGVAVCDIGAFEKLRSLNFRSVAAQDGWVLESGENSGTGGTLDSTAATFRLGDAAGNQQYRGILSFDTRLLPDTAVVARFTLKMQRQSIVGTNPFATHQNLLLDIRRGPFNGNAALELADFKAAASLAGAGVVNKTALPGGWYQATVNSATAASYVNKSGLTQFRLRFQLDDNNDSSADYIAFFSGNYGTLGARPLLQVEYYIP